MKNFSKNIFPKNTSWTPTSDNMIITPDNYQFILLI